MSYNEGKNANTHSEYLILNRFYMAMMVLRTCLIVMFICTLSVLLKFILMYYFRYLCSDV